MTPVINIYKTIKTEPSFINITMSIVDDEEFKNHQKQVPRPSTYKKSPKSCIVCGATFDGTVRALYCSNKCKQKKKNKKGKR